MSAVEAIVSSSAMRAAGLESGFASTWRGAWLAPWLVAFRAVLQTAPVTHRFEARLVSQP
ncbi:DUF2798 domain-containing protein [Piscinibacter sakaiensis]|uniref:DUF2798 domain-containing protein n=1 Tax=Piscinibacter sakaiensis TaxID=1547922 RepID=UPI003AAA53D2